MNQTILLLLLAWASPAAVLPQPCNAPARDVAGEQAMDDYSLAIAAQAAHSGDARSIVMAAGWLQTVDRFRNESDSKQAEAMLERAAELAGPDPVAWYLIAEACGAKCALEPDPRARWLALDPDNAAAWADELVHAMAAGDEGRARIALARAAGAERFDWYWSQSIAASVAAARAVPMPDAVLHEAERDGIAPADATIAYAVGVSMGASLPAVTPLIEACAAHPAWRDDCLRLAETIENRGDTLLARGLARGIARRLLAPGSPEAQALAERDRRYRWQMFAFGQLAESEGPSRTLDWLRRSGPEPAAFEAQLRDAGIALDAPPGWDAEKASAERAKRFAQPDPAMIAACEPSKP